MIVAGREAIAALAPTGTLHAAVNLANPATTTLAPDGSLSGPSVELAQAIAAAAGLPLAIARYGSAGAVTAAEAEGEGWDVAFLAIDPRRAERLSFSSPYLVIEATYAVAQGSDIRTIGEVDRAGHRIASSAGAAYDLHLQRTLTAAERVALDDPPASFTAFRAGGFAAVAGVRLALERAFPDPTMARVLPGSFLRIEHAVAVPTARGRAMPFIESVLTHRRRKS